MLDEGADETLSLKEIKVRIPVSFHLKLHAFKVLKGKPISDTIVEALDAYFKAAEQRKHAGEPASGALPHAGEPAAFGGAEQRPAERRSPDPRFDGLLR